MASKKKPSTGRPSSLEKDPALQGRIVALINAGNFPTTSAAACGVSERVFLEWMARGEDRDPERPAVEPFIAFAQAVSEARAKAEVYFVLKIREYIEGNRQHRGDVKNKISPPRRVKSQIKLGQVINAQWMLQRGFSQRWGLRPDGFSIGVTPQGGDEGESKGVQINVILAPPEPADG